MGAGNVRMEKISPFLFFSKVDMQGVVYVFLYI